MRLYENNYNIPLSLQIDNSLNSLTQSTQSIQTILNYAYIALNQNRFVLPGSPITVNISKYENMLCFLCKSKKASHGSSYEDK